MTTLPEDPHLRAIAREAQVELDAATTQAAPPSDDEAQAAAEIGYYEAGLRSLRDAATELGRRRE